MTRDSDNRDTGVTMRLRVVCTDRGAHPSRELGILQVSDDPEARAAYREAGLAEDAINALRYADDTNVILRGSKRGDAVVPQVEFRADDELTAVNYPSMRFRCPSCGRDVPLTGQSAFAIVTRLYAAGVSKLDVSHMGAIFGSS